MVDEGKAEVRKKEIRRLSWGRAQSPGTGNEEARRNGYRANNAEPPVLSPVSHPRPTRSISPPPTATRSPSLLSSGKLAAHASNVPFTTSPVILPRAQIIRFSRDKFTIHSKAVVCQDVELKGDITVGAGTIVHPKATIFAIAGPIVIGAGCIIEEGVILVNRQVFAFVRLAQVATAHLFSAGKRS